MLIPKLVATPYGYGDAPVLECSSLLVNIETGTSPFRYGCFVLCRPFSHVPEHSSQQEFDEDTEATDDRGSDADTITTFHHCPMLAVTLTTTRTTAAVTHSRTWLFLRPKRRDRRPTTTMTMRRGRIAERIATSILRSGGH